MAVERCKGSRDLGPGEMARFRFIEDTFRDAAEAWGYGEVRTPVLEYLHLFTSTGTLTPSMLGRVYSFLDWDGWSGERVVLRPDNTIPVARLYIDSLAGEGAARLFYVNNTFTFEPTGKANRERWQCGAELIGSGGSTVDVELISLAMKVLEDIGIKDVKIKVSHAGVIRGILKKAGLRAEDEVRIFDEILDGNGDTVAHLRAEHPELGQVISLLTQLKGKSAGFLKNLKAISNNDFPEMKAALDDFIAITKSLEDLEYDYEIDITSGRGFEYYTGVMFQLYAGNEKVGGGGRYDALIPLMGGENTPASGFALFVDPLMDILKPEFDAEPDEPKISVLVGPGSEKEAFDTASALRDEGYIVEFCHDASAAKKAEWVLDIGVASEGYTLIENPGSATREAADMDELLELLEELLQ